MPNNQDKDTSCVDDAKKITELELLAHRTWPCRKEEKIGDWVLREADGFTRRANSCLAIGDAAKPLPESVIAVEAWYRERELEPCFKITSSAPSELDMLLGEKGWTIATPSIVMNRTLGQESSSLPVELSASAIPDSDWLRTVSLWDGETPDKSRRHRELAQRIHTAGYLRWTTSEGLLAVGLVAMDGVESYLYDVVVHPERRGRGIGRAFCQAAMDWAASCGTRSMALQVLESNTTGQKLYSSLGFQEHHRYHYRVAPCDKPTCGC